MRAHSSRTYHATTIITGASSGIGRAAALAFAREGARLVLAARNPDPLRRTEADVRAAGAEVLVVPTDVTDEASVAQLVRGNTRPLRPDRYCRVQRRCVPSLCGPGSRPCRH